METLVVEYETHVSQRPHQGVRHPAARRPSFYSKSRHNTRQEKLRPRFRIDSIAPAAKRTSARFPMRVLLRNAKTQKFLGSGERWTKNPKEARDFRNGWWATLHAFTKNPRDLVIHYEFDDDRYNLSIAVLGYPKI